MRVLRQPPLLCIGKQLRGNLPTAAYASMLHVPFQAVREFRGARHWVCLMPLLIDSDHSDSPARSAGYSRPSRRAASSASAVFGVNFASIWVIFPFHT